jgi:MFS family permease
MDAVAAPDRAALQRRALRVLLLSQVLSGAGLAAGVTVGALLAEEMLGSTASAGLPVALFTLGSAAAALLVGRLSQRSGRRPGLAAGYAAGALGGAGIVLASAVDSPALLFACMFVYGSGMATNLQARYAGADLAEDRHRGRAVSAVLVATTLGAVVGPNLVEVTGDWGEALGVSRLAGPFILSSAAYAAGALVVVALLRPDPLLVARRLAAAAPAGGAGAAGRAAERDDPGLVRVAATCMVVAQVVMVAVMTMTPIHMRDHGHGLSATGLVISIHVAAMFLPSPLTGQLADRWGRRPTIVAGGVTLLAAGVVAALAPADSTVVLAVALGLLGLGWNLGLLGGTALVTDATPLATRARTQGSVDLAVAMSGAAGGLGSGVVVAGTSYAALAAFGGILGLAVLPVLLASRPAGWLASDPS